MQQHTCSICGFELTERLSCLPCDLVEQAIQDGYCHSNYGEQLAEQIGNVLAARNWAARPINLNNLFPRFA